MQRGFGMNIFKIKKKTDYNAEKRNKMMNYEYLNKHYCKDGQTVLAGDSITEIFNHTELYADYISKNGKAVYNRGISGDTSDKLLERFDCNVLNIHPSNIVLLIGTNDFAYGLTMDDTVHNITAILELIFEKCSDTNVILQAVYPINERTSKQGRRTNKAIYQLNRRLKNLAEQYNVTYIDLTESLSDNSGQLKDAFTYDGLHPTVFGFKVVAEKIIPLLK